MQIYVSQPTEKGHIYPYCVAKLNPKGTDYTPLRGEEYPTKKDADERAAELNRIYEEDCEESEDLNIKIMTSKEVNVKLKQMDEQIERQGNDVEPKPRPLPQQKPEKPIINPNPSKPGKELLGD